MKCAKSSLNCIECPENLECTIFLMLVRKETPVQKKCQLCGKDVPTKKIIKHHLSYSPEVIVELCRKCHSLAHKKDFSKGQARLNELKKEGRKKRMSLLVPKYGDSISKSAMEQ